MKIKETENLQDLYALSLGNELAYMNDLELGLFEQEGVGFVFPVRVSMASASVHAGGIDRLLTPGMSVTVEVKAIQRRVIEYLLTPLLRYRDEAIREMSHERGVSGKPPERRSAPPYPACRTGRKYRRANTAVA